MMPNDSPYSSSATSGQPAASKSQLLDGSRESELVENQRAEEEEEEEEEEAQLEAKPSTEREPISGRAVANSLSKIVSGDVLGDEWERVMYATDASPYEVLPLCVVKPKNASDVSNAVRFAFEHGISLIARGGGSGLVGGALGDGIVFDFTKYMNRVTSIENDSVVCEPGIYRNNLEEAVEKKDGLSLPPNPSSSAYCSIGGMIGTNASGAHSVKYGHTIDYLESVDLVLFDGAIVELSEVDLQSEEWNEIRRAGDSDHRSKIYNRLFDLISKNSETIHKSMPKVSKNSAGYRLDLAYDEGKKTFNPAKVVCGSEGTLGIVVSAKFKLIRKPKKRAFLILRYDSFKEMGKAIPSITKFHPSAAELMDKSVIEAAAVLNPEVKKLNNGKLIALIVEFDGDDENEIKEKLERLQSEMKKENKNESEIISDDQQIEQIWKMREESLGFAYKVREGEKRTEAVIEDTVVPPEKLGEYLEKLEAIYKKLGFDQMSWGHVSEGNIHTRPLVNYKSREGLEKAKKLADEVYDLAKSYHGSSTGEHSDGILRAPYIKVIYDEKMIELFKSVKKIFDPSGLMNPGKKTDGLNAFPLDRLRYGENYGTRKPVLTPYPSPSTYAMVWAGKSTKVAKSITGRDLSLDFEHEVESCFGCGKCREQSNKSRMCPVYDAEYNEVSACRGRNNLLRWMNKLEGLTTEFATTKQYGEAIYKNCIQCKMCLVDCPANTDVGKLMAEARARYVKVRGLPKGYKFFFEIDRYANYGCMVAPISNRLMKNNFVRFALEKTAGIDRRKEFPPFYRRRFIDRFYADHRRITASDLDTHQSKKGNYVVFFYDTYLNYNDPQLGMGIVKLFEKNGLNVIVPHQKSSGMPAIIEGDPDKGREYAKYNTSHLAPFAARGVPIVAFSPSAGLTLKNDYLDIYDNMDSRLVSENTFDIHEFLCKLNQEARLRRELMSPIEMKCKVHMHCHSIVQQVDHQVEEALHYIPGLQFETLNNGCCGNGGSYSFISGNYERSMKMGRGLIQDIKESSVPVYSTGESCKVQLEQGTGGSRVGLTSELLCKSFSVSQ